jgi:hypothetical protein
MLSPTNRFLNHESLVAMSPPRLCLADPATRRSAPSRETPTPFSTIGRETPLSASHTRIVLLLCIDIIHGSFVFLATAYRVVASWKRQSYCLAAVRIPQTHSPVIAISHGARAARAHRHRQDIAVLSKQRHSHTIRSVGTITHAALANVLEGKSRRT